MAHSVDPVLNVCAAVLLEKKTAAQKGKVAIMTISSNDYQ
jgi:hypothetical protein